MTATRLVFLATLTLTLLALAACGGRSREEKLAERATLRVYKAFGSACLASPYVDWSDSGLESLVLETFESQFKAEALEDIPPGDRAKVSELVVDKLIEACRDPGPVQHIFRFEDALRLVDFPVYLPSDLPEDVKRQAGVEVYRGEVTFFFTYAGAPEPGIGFTLTEWRDKGADCPRSLETSLEEIVPSPAVGGRISASFGRDGLCFRIQAPADGALSAEEILRIAGSLERVD